MAPPPKTGEGNVGAEKCAELPLESAWRRQHSTGLLGVRLYPTAPQATPVWGALKLASLKPLHLKVVLLKGRASSPLSPEKSPVF